MKTVVGNIRKLKIYLDTSVINFLYAEDTPDLKKITEEFFNNYIYQYDVYISDIVLFEINKTAEVNKKKILIDVIKQYPIKILEIENNLNIDHLAELYIQEKIIPAKKKEDALHIAISTVHECDILLSWNFKHLANIKKQIAINAINEQQGYLKKLNLLSPLEVENED